jgi:hypothetical protein
MFPSCVDKPPNPRWNAAVTHLADDRKLPGRTAARDERFSSYLHFPAGGA